MEHCDQIYDGLECRIRETAVRGLNVTTPFTLKAFPIIYLKVHKIYLELWSYLIREFEVYYRFFIVRGYGIGLFSYAQE